MMKAFKSVIKLPVLEGEKPENRETNAHCNTEEKRGRSRGAFLRGIGKY